jgi:dihydrofolate reductase
VAKFLYSAATSVDGFITGPGGDMGWLVDGAWHGPQIVLTHRPPAESPRDVMFAGDLPTAVEAARTAAGDQYVCILGASVAAQCQEAGVLDEVLMTVVPVLLGDGVRMFDRPGGMRVRLEPVSVTHTDVVANVWFAVTRP